MVQAIGSASFNYSPTSQPSSAILEARHESLQRQLSDWKCCVSAKATEGQAKIKDLSYQVRVVGVRLAEIAAAKPIKQTMSL